MPDFNSSDMLTVLVEVEGTHNLRPLSYDEDNPAEVLTPSDKRQKNSVSSRSSGRRRFWRRQRSLYQQVQVPGKEAAPFLEEVAEGIFIGLARAS